MLVGMEVSAAVAGRRTGVGHYVANLVSALRQEPGDMEFVYFSNRYDEAAAHNGAPLESGDIYPHDRLPSRVFWIQLGLGRSIGRSQPDICHFPNHLAPILQPPSRPFLVTVHDMSVYRFPRYQPLKTVVVHRAVLPRLAAMRSVIVTVTESARQDVLHYLRVPEERVRVVYEGVDSHFHPVSDPMDGAILAGYGLRFPYVLSVGTLEPRKNQARLIEAFAALVQEERLPHHLVLIGGSGWKDRALRAQLRHSPVADRVHLLGYVPTAHLAALYRGAEAFAFPSLYEGFGLPVLEALACGTPTLISTDPALVEVAGDAAVTVDPYDVDGMAAGLWQILSTDVLRGRLRARGIARAQRFTWDRCAAETAALYHEVLDVPVALPRVSLAR